jgi:Protein of unknown function (DUF541)
VHIRNLIGAVGVVALIGTAVACGGNDDGGLSGVRTQKGLSVAALTQGLTASQGGATETARGAAPAADTQAQPELPGAGYAPNIAEKSVGSYPIGPALQQGGNGVTVQGYGSATADADRAIVEFYFSRNSPATDSGAGRPEPGFSGSGGSVEPAAPELQEVAPITEADVQPVIDALVAAGVSRDDIEFVGQSYFDKFSSSATVRAKINNVDSVDSVVKAANDAAAGLAGVVLNSTSVSYTVNDCTALEEAAMGAAVQDAKERAAVFARSLGVDVGDVIGASNYSYFGGTPCDPGFYPGPYPLGGIAYAQGQPRQVQVLTNISVTYAIQ